MQRKTIQKLPYLTRVRRRSSGFSLIELLVVMGLILLLASLLLAAITKAKGRARQITCINNLRQIGFAVRLYADDARDKAPKPGQKVRAPYDAYKELVKGYLGMQGQPSPKERLFACPADTFYFDYLFGHYPRTNPMTGYVGQSLCSRPDYEYSSYLFNAGNTFAPEKLHHPGIAGLALSSIQHPARTVLLLDAPGLTPFSWHKPKWPLYVLSTRYCPNMIFNNAVNGAVFVDGHAGITKFYWNGIMGFKGLALNYDPPAEYDYQWSPN